jgi:hypothetical protein
MNSHREKIFANTPHHVGIMDFNTSKKGIPVRMFYPAQEEPQRRSVGSFVRGFAYFVEGYLHFIFPKWRESTIGKLLLYLIALVASVITPFAKAYLPKSIMGGQPAAHSPTGKHYPLVLYSHGLTGTGEENALMLSYWSSKGYVVAAIHHCEGSSCRVHPKGANEMLYEHPNYSNYDPNFRPNQIITREEELNELREFILHDDSFPAIIKDIIDTSRVFVAGFSYGAATAALSVSKRQGAYKACILLDGWFHIEKFFPTMEAFDFPAEAHSKGIHIPALFIGSQEFAGKRGIATATQRLVTSNSSKAGAVAHVLENSKHQNFTDVGYWVPAWILQRIGAIGACDYYTTHLQILELTHEFLDSHTTKKHS